MGRTQIILPCREHGGRFTKPEGRRGRNPVNCNPDEGWGCSAVETTIPSRKARITKPDNESERMEQARRNSEAIRGKLPAGAEASKQAREKASVLLESLGWTTALKGWAIRRDDGHVYYYASLTGNRGPETLYMEWIDGKLTQNDYAILDTVKPSINGKEKPEAQLPFNPEEVSDRELVRMISGTKITWWNTLGSKTETGICGNRYVDENGRVLRPPVVAIEHVYSGEDGPLGVDRLIKFTDGSGGGTRLIKVGALLKVG